MLTKTHHRPITGIHCRLRKWFGSAPDNKNKSSRTDKRKGEKRLIFKFVRKKQNTLTFRKQSVGAKEKEG